MEMGVNYYFIILLLHASARMTLEAYCDVKTIWFRIYPRILFKQSNNKVCIDWKLHIVLLLKLVRNKGDFEKA